MAGAGRPDVLIASDFPTQAPFERSLLAAVAFVLREHRFRAGRFTVGYQACDDSTPASGGSDRAKCIDNAKQVAAHTAVVGEVGPLDSGCAVVALPILNRAPHGPVALVSPTNSSDDLTRSDPFGTDRDAPASVYPTGPRSYARVFPRETLQARADAEFVKRRLGAGRVFVIEDDEPYGRGMAAKFTAAARALGVRIVGHGRWNPATGRPEVLAAAARRARPDAVFLGSVLGLGGDRVALALRRILGPKVALVAPDGFGPTWALWDMTHGASKGMYVSVPGTPNSRLGRSGRDFVRAFRGSQPRGAVGIYSTMTAAATETLLDAIARSDGTRAGVTRMLLRTRLRDSAIGPVSFDRYGDIARSTITFVRVEQRDGATDIDGYDAGPVVALLHPRQRDPNGP
jgi:branched-chain amino acid transport system substrate-binding protein